MRVSLITTGILELEGLASALGRLFPDHEFHAEPLAPKKPFHGFTANKVLALLQGDPDGHAVTMLRAALGTLIAADEATPAYELAVVLDDLELNNRGNEDVVIEHVRESAKRTPTSRCSRRSRCSAICDHGALPFMSLRLILRAGTSFSRPTILAPCIDSSTSSR